MYAVDGGRVPEEISLDHLRGYRLAIHIEPQGIRILTRGGHDWTGRFPKIAEAAKELGVASAIVDGEAVVLDEEGRPDFGALQRSLGGRGGKLASSIAIFFAFDLLYLDGHDLRKMELSSRRHLLAELLGDREAQIRFSEEIDGDSDAIFEAACEHGLEGVIYKDPDSEYRSDRTDDWVKVKCIQSDSSSSSATRNRPLPAVVSAVFCSRRTRRTSFSLSARSEPVFPTSLPSSFAR